MKLFIPRKAPSVQVSGYFISKKVSIQRVNYFRSGASIVTYIQLIIELLKLLAQVSGYPIVKKVSDSGSKLFSGVQLPLLLIYLLFILRFG